MVKKVFILIANLMAGASSAFAHGDEGGEMMGGGHMMDFSQGGMTMWLIVIILIGIIVYFILQKGRVKGNDGSSPETPLEIIKKRYAKGEISKDEFEKLKKDLEG